MKNEYECGKQKIIPAVLLYAFYQNQILMLHARGKDGLPGKWNGLGGKLDLGESTLDAAVREFKEEANCETTKNQWQWLGDLHFPNFKAQKNEDWWVTVFVTDLTEPQAKSITVNDELSPEGPLEFVTSSRILNLDLWEGDPKFLPFVFKKIPFQGTFFYENGVCTKHEISQISGVLG